MVALGTEAVGAPVGPQVGLIDSRRGDRDYQPKMPSATRSVSSIAT